VSSAHTFKKEVSRDPSGKLLQRSLPERAQDSEQILLEKITARLGTFFAVQRIVGGKA